MNINEEIKSKILEVIPDAVVAVSGAGGHFEISVTSSVFEGLRTLQKQRLVLNSIKGLMSGDSAPVHAIDKLHTLTPDA